MAKTFDNISEAAATNYLFLFAQRTLALQNEAPTPPPLNALGLPCEAMCLLWDWLFPEKEEKVPRQAPTTERETALDKKEDRRRKHSIFDKEAKKIATLAKKITDYILDHQDDAAQEDRWRTAMKRDMSRSFRLQREATQKVETEMQSMQLEVQSKMDETLQLVKNISDLVLKVGQQRRRRWRRCTKTLGASL